MGNKWGCAIKTEFEVPFIKIPTQAQPLTLSIIQLGLKQDNITTIPTTR